MLDESHSQSSLIADQAPEENNFADHTTFCCKCSLGDSHIKNRIVLCDKCDAPYHQFCHNPIIEDHTAENIHISWFCIQCTSKPLVEDLTVPSQPTSDCFDNDTSDAEAERCLSCASKIAPGWKKLHPEHTGEEITISETFRATQSPKSSHDIAAILMKKLCLQCHSIYDKVAKRCDISFSIPLLNIVKTHSPPLFSKTSTYPVYLTAFCLLYYYKRL